jgi:hypothetical protein
LPLPPVSSLWQRRPIRRLSTDPEKAWRDGCVQGMMDVLEKNYGGDITQMPYVVK